MSLLWDSAVDGYSFNHPKISFGSYNLIEPADDETKMTSLVMEIKYPKGSRAGQANKGGCGFLSNPKSCFPAVEMGFEYKVLFAEGFDFVLGGKLPGLYGGDAGACGGKKISSGFSSRVMWRKSGETELYLYIPARQHTDLKKITTHRDKFGSSIPVKDFCFKRNTYHKVRIYLKLNTLRNLDGMIKLYIDDKCYIDYQKMNFADLADQKINGIFFNTFFGGQSDEWASTLDTYTRFKDFKLFIN